MPAEDRQRQPFNLPKLARVNQSLRKGHTGGQDLKARGFKLAGVGGCDGARNNPAELQTINLTLHFNSISIVTSAFGPYAGAKENRANQQRQGHCSLCALHFRQCAPLRRATCRINDCGCNPFAMSFAFAPAIRMSLLFGEHCKKMFSKMGSLKNHIKISFTLKNL